MSGNAPVKKFRLGYVTASVWKNAGNNGDWHSVTLERSYRDDAGDIQNTSSLGAADLLNAAKLLQRAEEHIASL